MENRTERAKKLGNMLAQSRYDANKTQEYMALSLGVSRRTIVSWENGTSSPTMLQFPEWFATLNLNPTPYLFSFIYGKDIKKKEVNDRFEKLSKHIPAEDKEALIFLYTGNHGSSPHCLVQLLLAHLHVPLSNRVPQADLLLNTYKLHSELDTLICKEEILPNIEDLDNAIKQGRLSVIRKEYGYNFLNTTDK